MAELLVDAYVLEDEYGNYVNSNAISMDKLTRTHSYAFSPYLTNGPHSYIKKSDAEKELSVLQKMAINIKFLMNFHVQGINRYQVLLEESKNNFKAGFSPFKHCGIVDGLANGLRDVV